MSALVREYELIAPDGTHLPQYTAGAHIDLHLPGFGVRQYSLVTAFRAGAPYVIAVQAEPDGRGGSLWIHENLEPGQVVEASHPRNHFALQEAPHTLLIAGGIGLTPLFCMAQTCEQRGASHQLMVCGRSEERLIYAQDLLGPRAHGRVQFVLDGGDPARGLDIPALLRAQPAGTHVYCCGPSGLMAAVRAAGADIAGLTMHFEAFGGPSPHPIAPEADGRFTVDCRESAVVLEVEPGETILDRLVAAGIEVDHSCREGYCGTCVTRWLSGEPLHRDTCLGDMERGRYVALCTARAAPGSTLVLDL